MQATTEMTKSEALRRLGCQRQIDLARALGLSKQAVSAWHEVLTPRQANHVLAELYRRSQPAAQEQA